VNLSELSEKMNRARDESEYNSAVIHEFDIGFDT